MARSIRILTVIGARPQIIKAAALSRAVQRVSGLEQVLLDTGQHYDENMAGAFYDELGIPRAGISLNVGSASHGEQTARMLEGVERAVIEHQPDALLVFGDTNSTLAGSLVASKLDVPLAHVEAGLRSYDRHMPEEVNRIVSDHCSTWLFCPTDTAVKNLLHEGFDTAWSGKADAHKPAVANVGDVMFDNHLHFGAIARQRSSILTDLGLEPGAFALVTVHRAGNTDDPDRLNAIFRSILDLTERHALDVVLPLHPRSRNRMDALLQAGIRDGIQRSARVRIVPPAGLFDMIVLEENARIILTDSGGVQKEAYFCGTPCVILRSTTEWSELLEAGASELADADPARIASSVERFLEHGMLARPPVFGDGTAAMAVCQRLMRDLE